MKQLKNPWVIIPLILTASLFGALAPELRSHQLKNWADVLAALPDATFHAFSTTVCWIFFRSPWAPTFREFELNTKQSTPAGDIETHATARLTTSDPPPKEDA